MSFRPTKKRNILKLTGPAGLGVCLTCIMKFFEENGLDYNKDISLYLNSSGGSDSAYIPFMSKLTYECHVNLPDKETSTFINRDLHQTLDQNYEKFGVKSNKNCNLTTVVRNHNRCSSFCSLLFLLGQKRLLGPTGQIGLHAATGVHEPDMPAWYAAYGVNYEWVDRIRHVFNSYRMTYFMGPLLKDVGFATKMIR